VARGFLEDDKTKITWNLPRLLLPKNRVKLLLNMLLIAGQSIPRGGQIVVDPVGEGETLSFRISATGGYAKVPQGVSDLLAGGTHGGSVDAHAVQPYYTSLLARDCGLTVAAASEGEAIVVAAR
jgi:histidine phosphotransferase ChpT